MIVLGALRSKGAAVATGTIIPHGAVAAPTGYLLCDGSAVSRTTYANLFAAIGTTYGVGDGSTTFNVPNTSGLFLRGTGSQTISAKTFTVGAIGSKVGDSTAINGLAASTTSTPSLTMNNTDLTHTHTYNDLTTSFTQGNLGSEGTTASNSSPTNVTEADTTGSSLTTHTHTVTPTMTSTTTPSSSATFSKPGSITMYFLIRI